MYKKFIVILGPDGCGKTTFTNQLFLKIDQKKIKFFNFKFFFPELSRFLFLKKKKIILGKHSGMVKPLSPIHSNLLAIWYGIDYMFGNFIRLFSKYELLVCTRSYHDFFYQKAYRNVNKAIPNFFLYLGPRPDLIIILKRDIKSIYKDKNELSLEEIKIQYQRLKKFLGKKKNYLELDLNNNDYAADFLLKVLKNDKI